jgi:hypothetical protein
VSARVGRYYYPDPDGGGVYTLTMDGDTISLTFLPRYPDGQVAWDEEGNHGEVDFARIEPQLREQAHAAGRLLCRRAGLSPARTREVLTFGFAEKD